MRGVETGVVQPVPNDRAVNVGRGGGECGFDLPLIREVALFEDGDGVESVQAGGEGDIVGEAEFAKFAAARAVPDQVRQVRET